MHEKMLDLFLITTSLHIEGGDFNEINQGIVVRDERFVAGVYRNSFDETSVLVGGHKTWVRGDLEYGLVFGGVTGYETDWTIGGVTGFVAPFVTYRTEYISPTVLVLGSAITLSFKVEF